MSARHHACLWTVVLPLWMACITSASGELWLDPTPPLTWEDTLACPLVVVAQYESHEDDLLVLNVMEVLRGKHDPAQPLVVRLEHLYSIETRPVGWEADPKKGDDGTPRLCYKQQLRNPGSLVPMALRSDARQPAIYFFRDAERPVLKVRGQVHSPHFVKGWEQALSGKPMDLLFRLTQPVSSELSREALEELGKSRDPACLDQLFEWVLNRLPEPDLRGFDAAPLLARLGDQGGDVYDRAVKLIESTALGENEYRFGSLATIMAVVDRDRSWVDLSKLAKESDSVDVKKGALAGIGRLARRDAVELVLECLRDPELAQAAYWAIHGFIYGRSPDEYPRYSGIVEEKDRQWFLDELAKAGGDDRVPAKTRQDIQAYFTHFPRGPIKADLTALRTLLMNREADIYRGRIDRDSNRILRLAKEACDPAVVPIVAEALQSVPGASGNQSYSLPELASYYATICPRALRRELEERKLPARLAAAPFGQRNYKLREVMELAGLWMPEGRVHTPAINECFRLAQEVRGGKTEQLEELLAITDRLFAQRQGYAALASLLNSGAPAARERFLAYIDKAKEESVSQWSHERHYFELTSILYELHPNHRETHREIVVELLQSESVSLRRAGAEALWSAWQCDFDFDPLDLEAERTRKLAEIKPVLAQIASASEPQARVILLARAGFVVAGEPNESWLPTLVEAAGDAGHAAPHALRLVETIVGEKRARMFQHFAPPQRQRALRAYLQDMGKLTNHSQR